MSDILLAAPLYIIATNPYIVPNLPMIFGKFPGDEYYSLIKYMFFFSIIALIIFGIFNNHNKKLSADDQDANVAWSDASLIMFIVMLIYFLISVLFFPVQLIKLEYESIFNSVFFCVMFTVVSLIYALITDNIQGAKNPNSIKTSVFSIGIVILFILYVTNDSKISGGIPGMDLIPPLIKKLINMAIKLNGLRADRTSESSMEIMEQLQDGLGEELTHKLLKLASVAFASIPDTAKKLLNQFSKNTQLLDKVLGPVDLSNIDQLKQFTDNPMMQIILNIMPE